MNKISNRIKVWHIADRGIRLYKKAITPIVRYDSVELGYGNINLDEALEKLFYEGLRMPGAMCGLWGVCGAVTSIGAALSIIDGTGPLSDDGTWGNHMAFTSAALSELGQINGPRCCKRDAMIAFKNGIEYVNEHYDVKLEYDEQECEFYPQNQQCIKEKCPFYPD